MSDPIVGIDLGTSNTVVAHVGGDGVVAVLADDAGYKIHPSVVSFHPSGGVVVGVAAKQRKVIDPQNTIYSIKRLIGRAYQSPEVQTAKQRSPFQIKEGPSGAPVIATRGGTFAVPEISAIVLDHARNIAAARLGQPVERAVVTVPASFNDAQRSATATAGAIAGLTVVRVLNEPTAAALAYGHTRGLREIIAVYDFGGGTFDITFLRLEDQVYEVLGTSGDTFLGGDDFDERLVDKMTARFLADQRIDLRTNEVAMMRLRAVAEQTKIELSRRSRAVVRVDEIAYGPRGAPLNLQIEITRDEFVRDIADLVDRTFPVCSEALGLAGLSTDRIADVILVGGSTRIPYVREQVAKFFGKAPRSDLNPEDAVASGAALQAAALDRILSRPATKHTTAPPPVAGAAPEGLTLAGEGGGWRAPSELTEVTVAAPERGRRVTPSYGDALGRAGPDPGRPDTQYAVTRGGARDLLGDPDRVVSDPSSPPHRPIVARSERAVPPALQHTQPLGRMARPPGRAAPPVVRSAPPAPALDFDLGTGSHGGLLTPATGTVTPAPAAPTPATGTVLPTPATATATPPPIPRAGLRPPPARPAVPPIQVTAPLPGLQKPPERVADTWMGTPPPDLRADTSEDTQPLEWIPDPPTATQPMAPPLASPTSPTLIAVIQDLDSELDSAAAPSNGAARQRPLNDAAAARGLPLPAPPPIAATRESPATRAPTVLDVTPRGLGIATVGGFCEALIRRNVRIPAEIRKVFTTSRDNQDMVRIVVCQGESRRLDQNTVIGDLVLPNLPPRPRGATSIEVTFTLDAAGVLQVSARDAETGAEQRARLSLVGDVRPDEVAASRDRVAQLRR